MARIPGVGLAKGLTITLRHMLRKSVTQQYPEVKPALPPRSRGVIALVEENCTSCMLCARECPDWCIYIDSHKETIPAPEGGRARQRNVLDRFAIDFALCMYCGICIEVCPFDALFWSPEFEYAEGDIRNLLHEKDRLAAWTPTVPPPPAHDPGAEPPKELTAAPRRPAGTRTDSSKPAQPRRTPTTRRPEEAPTGEPPTPASTPPAPEPANSTTDAPAKAPAAPSPTPTERPRRSISNVRGIRPPGALPPQDEPSATPSEQPQQTHTPEAAPDGSLSTDARTDTGDTSVPTGTRTDLASDQSAVSLGRNDIASSDETQAVPTTADATAAASETETDAVSRGVAGEDAASEDAVPKGMAADTDPTAPTEPGSGRATDHQQSQGQASSTGESPPEKLSTAQGDPRSKPEPEEQTSAPSPRRRRMADPRSIRPPGRLGPDETRESEEES
ncbi:NuoI/complex I 23 kDa subunit family protein [Nonomuraea jiangxiensis]|uniref:NADH-quinone oxidoreductase subunit I n=1 Tax=Nonomuraea jiangxiensis TaxID=633440 RepID=A0A1G8MBM2_9ACTN|nr:NADH-quinone oxidoreductase subunit I [Nonomuraea jiangxiensis]SDI65334.1 Formate hydrogenlyase subunit 6/NADH:ubiquinone oxidoreductase subunit (chain I) [Nonomuraea jiangxiensis]